MERSRVIHVDDLPNVIRISELVNGGTIDHPADLPLIGGIESEQPCPWCTRPEGWDACPIHRDHD
jgi:hypothetical protein